MEEGDRVVFRRDGTEGVIEKISKHLPYLNKGSNVVTSYQIRDDAGVVHDIEEESVFPEESFRISLATKAKPSLPLWKCFKEVEAFKIGKITLNGNNELAATLYGEYPYAAHVTKQYIDKHNPQPGGYYVRYKDGYESYSPAEAFEEGYISVCAVGISSENLTANEVKNLRPGPIFHRSASGLSMLRPKNALRILARCADCLEELEVSEIVGSCLNSLMVTVKAKHDCLNQEGKP